jgi:hypothetical protein
MVEFTDSPHHQRPHIHLDSVADSLPSSVEEETVLVTPDGRMYTKPSVPSDPTTLSENSSLDMCSYHSEGRVEQCRHVEGVAMKKPCGAAT